MVLHCHLRLPVPPVVLGAENARLENAGWKTRHQTAGVKNARLEKARPNCRTAKRGLGK